MAAAKVGGIAANDTYPADFIRDNLLIQNNLIDAAYRHGARKFCFLGSSCIYPRLAPQPLHEESLLTGPLEPTNEAYAVAKIAGIKMCQAYRAAVRLQRHLRHADEPLWPRRQLRPANVARAARADPQVPRSEVGTRGDRHDLGHRARRAASFCTSTISRTRCCFLMTSYDRREIVNVGCGEDVTIAELAAIVRDVVGFGGEHRARSQQAGRHAAQAARREQDDRARLETAD